MLLLYAVCSGVGLLLSALVLLLGPRGLQEMLAGQESADPLPGWPQHPTALSMLCAGLAFFGLVGLTLDLLGRAGGLTFFVALLVGIPAGIASAWMAQRLTPQPD